MIVVAVVLLLVAIAVPNFVRSRRAAQVRLCITNLRNLEDSKSQWALDYRKRDTDIPVVDDVIPYLRDLALPECPANGTYRLRRVSRTPTCTLYPIGHTLRNSNMDDDALPD
jgi:hypothetical protein